MAPIETVNNAYSKFWGNKQRALWYVMVFSVVVNRPYSRRRHFAWLLSHRFVLRE